ncbi:MAG TPA: flagellar protein FlaG [Thermosulfurimonas dismutans]|uniref:Flagellar protein FlaG n=1 Tax=Thermosulfurimonas dismutans TaxID=999894 RepID=A0A7C3GHN1_9BACT|nr:flagellar protein FlaG [Thermosulfurimonas dismutans]
MRIGNTVRSVLFGLAEPETGTVLFKTEMQPTLSSRLQIETKKTSPRGSPEAAPKSEDSGELEKLLKEIREKFNDLNRYLKLEVDRELGVTVVKVIDRRTGKVLRQVPPEYLLEIMSRFHEALGLFINRKV